METWERRRGKLVEFLVEIRSVLDVVDLSHEVLLDFVADVQLLIALAHEHLEEVVRLLDLLDVHLLKLPKVRLEYLQWSFGQTNSGLLLFGRLSAAEVG